MVHYKLVKVTIDTPSFAKIIIKIVINYYGFFGLIIINRRLLLTSKFLSLLYYFLGI